MGYRDGRAQARVWGYVGMQVVGIWGMKMGMEEEGMKMGMEEEVRLGKD